MSIKSLTVIITFFCHKRLDFNAEITIKAASQFLQ